MLEFQLNTPVVFIIFNRPDTTRVVFDEIRKAKPPKLLVVADGPRRDKAGEAKQCEQTRRIIQEVDWDCEVITNFAADNLGCRERIVTGLAWVFSLVEEAIILEDDCVPHPSFFRFCQETLAYYRNESRIMMISGTNYLVDKFETPDSYFFSRHYSIWGWATWRRAWKSYDPDIRAWRQSIGVKQLRYQCADWKMQKHFEMKFDMITGRQINTWDFQWVFNCLFNNGLCLTAAKNLITNIGVVGTHSDAESDSHFLPGIGIEFPLRHPTYLYPDCRYDQFLFRAQSSKIVLLKRMIESGLRSSGLNWLYEWLKVMNRYAKNIVKPLS